MVVVLCHVVKGCRGSQGRFFKPRLPCTVKGNNTIGACEAAAHSV